MTEVARLSTPVSGSSPATENTVAPPNNAQTSIYQIRRLSNDVNLTRYIQRHTTYPFKLKLEYPTSQPQ